MKFLKWLGNLFIRFMRYRQECLIEIEIMKYDRKFNTNMAELYRKKIEPTPEQMAHLTHYFKNVWKPSIWP